ncbi:hypothetical protein [Zavarzinella formosa]|uniref:hypothetical protein n=1 Tax=Zavarzinella formosa TaxID=360055 RepID=UPI0009FD2A52|nr:hypothetical protein [Zavarzinella formosa]
MSEASKEPDANELVIVYSTDIMGEPVRSSEYQRLCDLLRDGWILIDLSKTSGKVAGAITYAVRLRPPGPNGRSARMPVEPRKMV